MLFKRGFRLVEKKILAKLHKIVTQTVQFLAPYISEFKINLHHFYSFLSKEWQKPLEKRHLLLLKKYSPALIPVLLVSIVLPILQVVLHTEPLPLTLISRNGKPLKYQGQLTYESEKKYSIDVKSGQAQVRLQGVTSPPEDVTVYVDKPVTNDTQIVTNVLFVDDHNLSFEAASVTLQVPEGKRINAILTCPTWNFDVNTGTCSEWEVAPIKPEVKDQTLAFNVNHFSAYAGAYLEILNVQSNLTVGDIWEKRFNTYGTADLTVEAIDGTVYGTDVMHLEMYCGDTKLENEYQNGKIFIENYNCDGQLSRLVDRSVTPGIHHLQFTFGDTVTLAKNFACDVGTLDDTCEVSSSQAITDASTISGTGNLTIKNGGNLSTSSQQAFTISMGGTVTIESGGNITGNLTNLTAANLDIQSGGNINVSGKGYPSSSGPGEGTDGTTYKGGGGGGYGGYGGDGNTSQGGASIQAGGNSLYGDPNAPTDYGSGGGANTGSYPGGAGGGKVRITVSGTTTVAGNIYSNGNNGSSAGTTGNYMSGAGSGGSIYISTGTLAGSGSILANGGAGGGTSRGDAGGGAGGRIALNYTTKTYNGTLQAKGGSAPDNATDGGAGTIVQKPSSQTYGTLYFDNSGQALETYSRLPTGTYTFYGLSIANNAYVDVQDGVSAEFTNTYAMTGSVKFINTSTTGDFNSTNPLNLTLSSGTVTITGGENKLPTIGNLTTTSTTLNMTGDQTHLADVSFSSGTITLDGTYSGTNLTVGTGGIVTHPANSSSQTYTLPLTFSGNVTLSGTGKIDVSGKGYASEQGPGQGTDNNTAGVGSGGASYGGHGGLGQTGLVAGDTYGSMAAPAEIGSGGGGGITGQGGAGGGLLVATISGTLDVGASASIVSNGNAGGAYGSGGSGGGISITTGTFAGSGTVTANGGNGGNVASGDSGGGGGGRIAVYYTSKTFSGTLMAAGGSGPDSALDAAPGTVYEKAAGSSYPNLTFNNNNLNPETAAYLPAGSYDLQDLTILGYARFNLIDSTTITVHNSFAPTASFYLENTSSTGTISYPTLDVTTTGTAKIFNGSSKWPIRDITISSGTLSMNGEYNVRNVVVATGAILTHEANSTTQAYDLQLHISDDLTLNGTGKIDVSGKGYANDSGPGAGETGLAHNGGAGGGHGGAGGNGNTGKLGGSAYDSQTNPTLIGSGGGTGVSKVGGLGGGAAILEVGDTTTINSSASILANATAGSSNGTDQSSGGGAGGTVNLSTRVLTGSGSITANGGSGGNGSTAEGGGGAGGRILVFSDSGTYSGSVTANGATGPDTGGEGSAGTVYTDYTAPVVQSINDICGIAGNQCTAGGEAANPQEAYGVGTLSGSISESETNLVSIQISVKDTDTNLWYNPNTNAFDQNAELLFDTTTTPELPSTGTINWEYDSSGVPFEINHTYLITSVGSNAKRSSSDTVSFVFTNSPPTVENVTATQNSDGTVSIGYDVSDNESSSTTVRVFYDVGTTLSADLDTSTGDISVSNATYFPTSGSILIDDEMISYSSKSGNTLSGITRGALNSTNTSHSSGASVYGLATATSGATGSQTNGTGKSITWTAKTDSNGFYSTSAKVIVVANDGATSQMVGKAASSNYTLDVKNPAWTANFKVDASQDDPLVTIPCSDDSSFQMKVGLSSDVSDVSWTTYASTATISTLGLTVSDPFTIYGQCKDAKNNSSTILSATTPDSPNGMFFQDVSNSPTSEWREFVTWNVIDDPSSGFDQYQIYRKVDSGSYSQLTTISDRSLNYIIDTGLSTGSSYSYKVRAIDDQGNVSYYSSVVSDSPEGEGGTDNTSPVLTGVSSSSISATQATITWTSNELANSKVYYKASSTYPGSSTSNYDSSVTVSSVTSSHSVTLGSLTPGTKYYFMVTSDDPSSNTGSSASATYTFTTTDGPAISTVTITRVFDSEATVSWQTDQAANSVVRYSTASTLSGATTGTTAGDTTTHSVTLTGLTANTKYYFQVESTDADSNQSIDNNVVNGSTQYYSFTTTNDEVGPVISNLTAALVGQEGLTITWQTDEVATSQLLWDTDATLDQSTTQTNVYTNFHSVTLTDLDPETEYFYQVVSVDKSGNSTTSSPTQSSTTAAVVTDAGDTTAPTYSNIDVTDLTASQATITWLSNEDADSFVKFGTASDNLGTTTGAVESVTSHSVTLKNLTGSTTYYFKVIGRDTDGNTSESTLGSFTTKASTTDQLSDGSDETNELMDLVVSIIQKASKTFLVKVLDALIDNPKIGSLSEDQVVSLVSDISDKSISAPSLSTAVEIEPLPDSAIIKWTTNKPANSLVAFAPEADYKEGATDPYTTEAGDSQAYTTDHEVTLVGLQPNTPYHIQARSKDRFGPVASSKDTTFTTTSQKPEIQDLSLSSANETSVIMTWKTTLPTKRVVTLTNTDTGEQEQYADPSLVKVHKFQADDLSPSSSYVALIALTDENGETTTSSPVPFSTVLTAAPPEISEVKVVTSLISGKVDKVQSIISWKTNKPSSSKIIYQQGVKSSGNQQEITEEGLKREHILITTEFTPGQVYQYKVVSSDIAGNTAESQNYTLLTPKPKESVVDLIVNNVEEMFGFLKR